MRLFSVNFSHLAFGYQRRISIRQRGDFECDKQSESDAINIMPTSLLSLYVKLA